MTKWNPDNMDVLQNLEFVVVEAWRENPKMTDYTALRAYEAAFQYYRAQQRGQTPKPHGLSGLDATVFESVKTICEFRLGRGDDSLKDSEAIPLVPLQQLIDCLRELGKSVQRHTKEGGRQGYLTFINRFLP